MTERTFAPDLLELILPWCNTAAMNLRLAAISADIATGRHAALLLDQAGWHLSPKLAVPDNITIVPLPAKCPELNALESVWQFMHDNWLSNRFPDRCRPCQSLRRCMEQAGGSALADHVNRNTRLGT